MTQKPNPATQTEEESKQDDVKAAVRQQFSAVAANYSTSTVHAAGVDLAEMVRAANLLGIEEVLDAGCGAGHTALTFAPHVKRVLAVDLSASMLDQVQQLASERQQNNLTCQLADVEALTFADASFDLVTTRYSAHHWPHPQQALHHFRRVLKPGGQFLLSDIVSHDDFTVDTFIQSIELLRDPSHVRDHTTTQWLAMLNDAGFSTQVAFQWDLRLDFTSWVVRMATPADQVAMLRKLLDLAPHEVRQALKIEPDHSFTLQGALFVARVANSPA